MADGLEQVKIQWHPGFYGAAELELIENKEDLEFLREYNLSKEPIRMDLLIIKKLSDVPIRNEIGHIFKKYNVVEYKSPDDGLSVDDYYKTVGYACLYKGLGETENRIPAGELTISIFRESYPRELFEELKRTGLKIEEHCHGIYYISGKVLFDTQIVVTGRLDKKHHSSLKILSKKVREEDIRTFIEESSRLENPGDRNNADAVLQVSVSANKELYREIRRNFVMCEALRELMKDEIEEEKRKAVEDATRELKKTTVKELEEVHIKSLMENMKWTAEKAMAALNIPASERTDYAARL